MKLIQGAVIGAVFMLALLGALTAIGQTGTLFGTAQPVVIDIAQAVPVVANVQIPVSDGDPISATIPLTVDIALRVSINGDMLSDLQVTTPTIPAQVTVPVLEDAQQDDLGIPFTVVLSEGSEEDIALTEWVAYTNESDDLVLSGKVKKLDSASDFNSIVATVRVYGEDDSLIKIADTQLGFFLNAGQTERFEILPFVDVDNVKRYEVELVVQ